MKVGLVLEGGAARGVFTAGVLDYWMEQGLMFPYIAGVSIGAWIIFQGSPGARGTA